MRRPPRHLSRRARWNRMKRKSFCINGERYERRWCRRKKELPSRLAVGQEAFHIEGSDVRQPGVFGIQTVEEDRDRARVGDGPHLSLMRRVK